MLVEGEFEKVLRMHTCMYEASRRSHSIHPYMVSQLHQIRYLKSFPQYSKIIVCLYFLWRSIATYKGVSPEHLIEHR